MSEEQSFTLDGRQIPFQDGQTLMTAALAAGVYIPHLCFNREFAPHGSCRVCLVKVNGRMQAACTTPAAAGQRSAALGGNAIGLPMVSGCPNGIESRVSISNTPASTGSVPSFATSARTPGPRRPCRPPRPVHRARTAARSRPPRRCRARPVHRPSPWC